ncbi:MAG: hypothetical protein QM778_18285 [Myxococcales bacterium]
MQSSSSSAATKPVSLPRRVLAWMLLVALGAGLCAWLWLRPWEALGVIGMALVMTPMVAIGLFPGIWRRRSECLPDAASDLDRRRPVWSALSELYLDTELDGADHARIALVLQRSGYSLDQAEEILYRELHPVLIGNLLSGLGEWAGFDERWVEQRVLARGVRRGGFALIPGKFMVRGEWERIRAASLFG